MNLENTVFFCVDPKLAMAAGNARWGWLPVQSLDETLKLLTDEQRAVWLDALATMDRRNNAEGLPFGAVYLRGSQGSDASTLSVIDWLQSKVNAARQEAMERRRAAEVEVEKALRAKTRGEVPLAVETSSPSHEVIEVLKAHGVTREELLERIDAAEAARVLALPRAEQRKLLDPSWHVRSTIKSYPSKTHGAEIEALAESITEEIHAEERAAKEKSDQEKKAKELQKLTAKAALTEWARHQDAFARAVAEGYDVVSQADDAAVELVRAAAEGRSSTAVLADEEKWSERSAPSADALDTRFGVAERMRAVAAKLPAAYEVEVLRVMRVTAPDTEEENEDGDTETMKGEKYTAVVVEIRCPLWDPRHVIVRVGA